MRVKYDINTKYCCQIGYPLDYSCAAYVHNEMYDFANQNAICLSVEVKPEELEDFIKANKAMHMLGFDITTPHKTKIIEYCDEVDEASRIFKCVNHVRWEGDKLVGVGLDGVGMGRAIVHAGMKIEGAVVLILGAGAVAGPIAADLCSRGAKKVTIVNRTLSKAEYIAEKLKELYHVEADAVEMTVENLARLAPTCQLVVQCTSMGAAGHKNDYENLDFIDLLPEDATIADVLYPTTSFLERGKARGLRTINGMGMLTQQQIAMMKFRFGVDLPEDEALAVAENATVIAAAMRDKRLAGK